MGKGNGDMVSVIVPVYNGAAFIVDTLCSVRDQTHSMLECIVVDDGSVDDTAKLVKEWIQQDSRFIYFYQPNRGLSAARNTGLDHAKGTYIQFLDADDVILPSKLEEQLTSFPPGEALSYTDYSTGLSGDIYQPSSYYRSAQFRSSPRLEELIERWESSLVIPPHCFLFKASFFYEKGLRFDTNLPNHEDFDCWVNIFRLNPSIEYLDKKLCIYRVTENSMSKKMKLMAEGFLQVLDKQLLVTGQSSRVRKLLNWKRRETIKRYIRLDKMKLKDKVLMLPFISAYYIKRIFHKAGFAS
jgi:glycosyltransferase involved in cell wall biosynthesis